MKPKFSELEYQSTAINTTIEAIQNFPNRDEFAIEMETGTGKTYVFIRTIFEAYKKLGLSKFIIVAPTVAVREGIRKSFEILKTISKKNIQTLSTTPTATTAKTFVI